MFDVRERAVKAYSCIELGERTRAGTEVIEKEMFRVRPEKRGKTLRV